MSSSLPAATATEPPGASQRSAPSGSCPHPKQRVYLSSISGRLRASGSGHPAACPDARVTVTPRRVGHGGGRSGAGRALSPGAPAVTHAALGHGWGVPGGPRPSASSRPGHKIPGGWANTGCKTHTAGTGVQRRAPRVPPASPGDAGRAGKAPAPIWGLTAGGSSPRPWPSTPAGGTRCQRRPLRGTGAALARSESPPRGTRAQTPPQGGSSGTAEPGARGRCEERRPPNSPRLPPGELKGLGCPRAQPHFRYPQLEVAPHGLQRSRCLWGWVALPVPSERALLPAPRWHPGTASTQRCARATHPCNPCNVPALCWHPCSQVPVCHACP